MRIIAGTHRGRRILPPEGQITRPITDRVKQSLFDRLASADRVDGAVVLDVFAGTGSLGLECLSRGAAHVTFIEQDRTAVRLLERNLETLRETDRSRILRINALSLGAGAELPRSDYAMVFFDPPYAMAADPQQAPRLWRQMARIAAACTADAWLVLRMEKDRPPPPAEDAAMQTWGRPQSFGYGSMTLHLFRRGQPTLHSGDGLGP